MTRENGELGTDSSTTCFQHSAQNDKWRVEKEEKWQIGEYIAVLVAFLRQRI